MNWDQAYANSAYIPNGKCYPALWAEAAAQFRFQTSQQKQRLYTNHQYGRHAQEVFDLFQPAYRPRGLVIFVHGGYWMQFDPSYWSHLAQGALARGWPLPLRVIRIARQSALVISPSLLLSQYGL